MENKELYRVLVIGPTGSGKSQFCNFVQRDVTNLKNKVSHKLQSCTKAPKSNVFTRNNTNYDFIDSAGSSDSDNKDIANLNSLIDFIKEKESIDYISLLLKFGERITNETKKYLETLGKIFTAREFYTHLCVFFTKFPVKPKKKDLTLRQETIEEINKILKGIFQIDKNIQMPKVNVYFIDTEFDEDENAYDEKSQKTIDIMIKQMKLDIMKFNSINTKDFDVTGENCKLRKENEKKQIEELVKRLEEEKLKKEKEEEEKKRIQEEIQKMKEDNEKKEKKQEELNSILKKQEEERKKLELLIREAEERERKIQEEQRKIEEEAENRNIEIERLNRKIDDNLSSAGFWIIAGVGNAYITTFIEGLFFYLSGASIDIAANTVVYSLLPCVGLAGLSVFPLLGAGFYYLKKLAT